MARYTGPVCRLCRQQGVKLFLKGEKCHTNCVLDKRNTPPGPPAKKLRPRMSEYSIRLREKQKVRTMAGMTERPFANLFERSAHEEGSAGENLLRNLELRLDHVARRLGFSASLKQARQLVLHGHVKVNGKKVNIPSYRCKVGDKVSLDPKLKENLFVKQGLELAEKKIVRPSYLEFNAAELSGKILRQPTRKELNFPVEEQLVIEYYSK